MKRLTEKAARPGFVVSHGITGYRLQMTDDSGGDRVFTGWLYPPHPHPVSENKFLVFRGLPG
jgi:hypothetical protein